MMLDKVWDLLQPQVDFGGFYNRYGAKLSLAEVSRERGQAAVDKLIAELKLDEVFQVQPGEIFKAPS